MDENLSSILTAKVTLLELLVRALLREECFKMPDPEQAMENLYQRLKVKMETQATTLPTGVESERAATIVLENFEMFFDGLRSDIRKARPDQKHS